MFEVNAKNKVALEVLTKLYNERSDAYDFWTEPRNIDRPVDIMVPPAFVSTFTNLMKAFDVDYKVMGTFLEFYQGLVKFVNYKLFSDAGLQYPIKDMNPVSRTSVYLDPSKVRQM